MPAAPHPSSQLLAFTVGDRRLGLPAAQVQEVLPMPRISRVPYASDTLLGVANMRGTVIPVISVGRLIGQDRSECQRVIVVNEGGLVGLAVTSVEQFADHRTVDDVSAVDIAELVARAVPEKRQRRSSQRVVASADRTARHESVPLVALTVGSQAFALPVSHVEEIVRAPEDIARMPHSDAVVMGTMLLQGAVLPLLSLAALLALPPRAVDHHARVVVVRIGTHRVGLLVEAMQSVMYVAETDIDPVPQALNRGGAEARIQAICRLGEGQGLLSVLAADKLLREDIMARLLQGDGKEQGEMTGSAASEGSERFLLFRIGDDSFGLPIDAVEEVVPLPSRLTPLPKAPDFVQGVMNVRGKVIPVIDQARRFNGTAVESAKPRVIVVRIGALIAGFIVDAVSEVALVHESALREAPDMGGAGTRIFDRVAALGGGDDLVLIISPQELLDRAEQDVLAKLGKKGMTRTP
ncbi:chemotaxis protein CheW [Sphingobium sp. AP49]|uniref:chemotaxis protein CheW n=1 Tax=Sphingobium sp. AP49 TaxID=1144307 RepID=UPI00026ED988|nr:chemotaxis protein CheW [Sphingobium sp. AP49]WHO39369.1 chemotaxis protein CheW [Sphingobium sp. AP49]